MLPLVVHVQHLAASLELLPVERKDAQTDSAAHDGNNGSTKLELLVLDGVQVVHPRGVLIVVKPVTLTAGDRPRADAAGQPWDDVLWQAWQVCKVVRL